jgi:hypothetical protein
VEGIEVTPRKPKKRKAREPKEIWIYRHPDRPNEGAICDYSGRAEEYRLFWGGVGTITHFIEVLGKGKK